MTILIKASISCVSQLCTSLNLIHSGLSHFMNESYNHHSVNAFCTSFFFLGLLPPSSSSSELLFFAELGSLGRPDEPMLDLLPPLLGVELELLFFLYVFMNSAISSGQSRFFSGSHVLCLLWKSTKQHISINTETHLLWLKIFNFFKLQEHQMIKCHYPFLPITVIGPQFLQKVVCFEHI